MNKTILITGAAGFIGYHLAKRMIAAGWQVIGLDSINSYYDVELKYNRLKELGVQKEAIEYGKIVKSEPFLFIQLQLENTSGLMALFETYRPAFVCNLAAQAGVRYSLENPQAYIDSNIVGFTNILEACRTYPVEHLVYASSSSVYGLNAEMPFSPHHGVNHPVSLYAATKKSNELMAHVYSQLFAIPTTGLRFFTVYGPWGRPDMSPMLFADAIVSGRPIKVFNYGDMGRDFTYIDDIVEGVLRVINKPATANVSWNPVHPDPASSSAPYKVFNIGSSSPVRLLDYIETLEKALGIDAHKELLPMQPGDIYETFSDMSDLVNEVGYKPTTKLDEGLKEFATWYIKYYSPKINN